MNTKEKNELILHFMEKTMELTDLIKEYLVAYNDDFENAYVTFDEFDGKNISYLVHFPQSLICLKNRLCQIDIKFDKVDDGQYIKEIVLKALSKFLSNEHRES